ncbi:MAG: hypothetical protein KatS3mg003_1793 [Candidatus Nitrosocaldaceae archaeon]|nr:MAG: hypothetical protein KatS3mg003_1793 [Candidatus Nitrosocaldaceae archaeon]
MHVEVICSKCNYVIYRMKILRAVRDVLKNSRRCPSCNALLTSEFNVLADKI